MTKSISLINRCLAILVPCAILASQELKAAGKGLPSEQLDRVLDLALSAILEPLENDPKMPRVEVEKLRSNFAGDEVRAATAAHKQIYQNAMLVCDSLTKGMDDRAASRAAAVAASTAPNMSTGGSIVKSSSTGGNIIVRGSSNHIDTGGNAEAIRKKQIDERNYEDKRAGTQASFAESASYRAWSERAVGLRKQVMALYTRQVQLEAAAEGAYPKSEAPQPTSVPPSTSAPPATPAPQPVGPQPNKGVIVIDKRVRIPANDPNGYPIGSVQQGDIITLQYIDGLWKHQGGIATENPDINPPSYKGADRLVLAEPGADNKPGEIIQIVPPETARTPFSFVFPSTSQNVVLRIHSNSQRKGNPGTVLYSLKITRP